ncbi:RNA polymerase sigma factor [Actinophytocola sp.]|uniref:RNA polymerase sigma factor n=1 Tax=Actinophytocola sp. TaxID=1872138 RepID=UPI002D809332|nr:sigma-70 family RNA polymerase sigma factor [Actinophytocola sp.]HET9141000.1 sigma-70 family RNA polymerase sigma factor [Actinophytocola sp.]
MVLPARQFLDRLIAGDETALAELYDVHGATVLRLALRVTGDWAAAQDITQEVFVYVWEHPSRFDPDRGDLRSWLGVIAHRRAVDWVRRETAHRRRHERTAVDEQDATPGPADLATSSVLHDLVRQAVDALPADQRTAIRLAYFEGHTYRRVADALGIPEGTAKSRLRLALAALGRRLGAEGMP